MDGLRTAGGALRVECAAVLGAGVMGAQIAAHLVNADIPVLLFDLADPDGSAGPARRAVEGLAAMDPAPLSSPGRSAWIEPLHYDAHLPRLQACDLVIEAISERADLKRALYARIAPHLAPGAVLATNTSGLSVAALAADLPPALAARTCGVHFFNPPRYMTLVELVDAGHTDAALLDALETFLTTRLGRNVLRTPDRPNFVANRIGTVGLLSALHHTTRLGLRPDAVDAVSGTLAGRARSATFRTIDLVGLDVLEAVVRTLRERLPEDPWHPYFELPEWLRGLREEGALGRKAGRGIYRKQGGVLEVFDPASGSYVPADASADEGVAALLRQDPAGRLAGLRGSDHPQGQFLWSVTRDLMHYAAVRLDDFAYSARDVDRALRWGFGWEQGIFEQWQEAGWQRGVQWLEAARAEGTLLAAVPLPDWARDPARTGVHGPAGSWSPRSGRELARPALPVYARQLQPQPLAGEPLPQRGATVLDTGAVRLWDGGCEVGVLSFLTKRNTIGEAVLEGVLEAIEAAAARFRGLVLCQLSGPFSLGADLSGGGSRPAAAVPPSTLSSLARRLRRQAEGLVLQAAHRLHVADRLMAGRLAEVERILVLFQHTTHAWKHGPLPTVAAVDGMALGGGCEFVMHSAGAVATLESYIGLVEAGVGLLPAGGGCKELVLRVAREARSGDLFPALRSVFEMVALARVSRSAEEAREMGLLSPGSAVVMHRGELLWAARAQALALSAAGYRPPLPAQRVPVAGRTALATLTGHLVNLQEGGQISAHDMLVATRIAEVLCGGDVDPGTLVDEDWLLGLERRGFLELAATQKTQERVAHTLRTGKPLRN